MKLIKTFTAVFVAASFLFSSMFASANQDLIAEAVKEAKEVDVQATEKKQVQSASATTKQEKESAAKTSTGGKETGSAEPTMMEKAVDVWCSHVGLMCEKEKASPSSLKDTGSTEQKSDESIPDSSDTKVQKEVKS